MNQQHTPGPWKVSDQNDQAVVTAIGDFYWWSWVHLPHQHEQYGINPQADARLIAAAPELLEALILSVKDAQTSYRVISEANKEMGFDAPKKPLWLQQAEAVIQKVTQP
ncbi:hypothetical protein [Spirosoma sp. 48-14]|uniref:hypothetical protein n=1 Tax=Spirosoma sp. 48-14 TaxID=1895854 RepID=UPI000960DA05|nr:hypothetical protein [Spirosoma sp. 48-14]OJW75684.1 MAG: hypothetical protein BGO59_08955 [Spirosoma sp. 48-14]